MFNNLEESNSNAPAPASPATSDISPTLNASPTAPPATSPSAPMSSQPAPTNLPVDDIFAETDKVSEPISRSHGRNGGDIETKKVGLISEKEKFTPIGKEKGGRSLFKILTAVILVVILGLGAYLAYTKFFSSSPTLEQNLNVNSSQDATPTTPVTPTEPTNVTPPTDPVVTTPVTPVVPEVEEEPIVPTEPIFVPIIDSDDDGLTDDEEIIAGTNINIIDTDNDGVSDYEEVKIYKSNPLNADTDGDGYQDGEEIRGGYNPNGAGMMPGIVE